MTVKNATAACSEKREAEDKANQKEAAEKTGLRRRRAMQEHTWVQDFADAIDLV